MARTPRQEWARRIRKWSRSGLTATQFAGRLGVKEATLRWWKWQLRERASMHWLGCIARRDKKLFVLWQLGVVPEAGG